MTTKHTQLVTNEIKVRIIAFFVFLLCCMYAYTSLLFIPLILIVDFGLRSVNLVTFSPLAVLADVLVAQFQLPDKPVFLPPKRFAARIGFGSSIAIAALHIAAFNTIVLTAILLFFAALEAFAGFCAGCYLFNYIQRLRRV